MSIPFPWPHPRPKGEVLMVVGVVDLSVAVALCRHIFSMGVVMMVGERDMQHGFPGTPGHRCTVFDNHRTYSEKFTVLFNT